MNHHLSPPPASCSENASTNTAPAFIPSGLSAQLARRSVVTKTSPPEQLRSMADAVPLPWDQLQLYLARRDIHMDMGRPPRQFSGGLANLNYLIELNGASYVLRRPPLGEVLPGANDMAREYRVLSALSPRFEFAPRTLLYCDDSSVLGAHFLIMEYRQGLTVGGDVIPSAINTPDIGTRLGNTMIRLLAQLHALDPATVGLGTLGRPEGFLARAIEGWSRRAEVASDGRATEAIRFISTWLAEHRVPEIQATLLHCDFKLDNLILHPDTLAPVAILDWDMATRGDPLFDLATLLSYWTEAADPPAMHRLAQMPTAAHGFPSRNEVVADYARATGRDVSNFVFHRVLCLFKLAVVFLQLHARFRSGATTDERYADFGELAAGILDFTHDVALGRES